MNRVNEHEVYELAKALAPLSSVKQGQKLKDLLFDLYHGRNWLVYFLSDNHVPLNLSKHPARKILKAIGNLLPNNFPKEAPPDLNKELTWNDQYALTEGLREFETVLASEFQDLDTYFVSQKGIYKTADLLARAEMSFSEDVRGQLPQKAINDLKQFGKCLAFDLGTAAGFHIARAVESVLLVYLETVAPLVLSTMKLSDRNLGNYIRLLNENGGDSKITAALNQFRDLHRNPLMHPEADLTADEAMALFGIAQSVMIAMLLEIKRLAPLKGVAEEAISALQLPEASN